MLSFCFLNLSGCATIRKAGEIKSRCETSRVLITDLTQNKEIRVYQLPSGEICSDGVA